LGFSGRKHAGVVEEIVRDGMVSVQAVVNGQSTEAVERLVDAGADRLVLHASAVDDPSWIETLAHAYPSSVLVATDVRERRTVTRGWVRSVPVDIFDLIGDLEGLPLAGLLISVANGNGSASTAELALLEDLAETSGFPVLTSGGVSTIDDLRALEHRGVSGAVLGTALYSGALDARAVAQEFSA